MFTAGQLFHGHVCVQTSVWVVSMGMIINIFNIKIYCNYRYVPNTKLFLKMNNCLSKDVWLRDISTLVSFQAGEVRIISPQENARTIQNSYRRCGTHAWVLSSTVAHENNKNEKKTEKGVCYSSKQCMNYLTNLTYTYILSSDPRG